jgi:hypothetical protein
MQITENLEGAGSEHNKQQSSKGYSAQENGKNPTGFTGVAKGKKIGNVNQSSCKSCSSR